MNFLWAPWIWRLVMVAFPCSLMFVPHLWLRWVCRQRSEAFRQSCAEKHIFPLLASDEEILAISGKAYSQADSFLGIGLCLAIAFMWTAKPDEWRAMYALLALTALITCYKFCTNIFRIIVVTNRNVFSMFCIVARPKIHKIPGESITSYRSCGYGVGRHMRVNEYAIAGHLSYSNQDELLAAVGKCAVQARRAKQQM